MKTRRNGKYVGKWKILNTLNLLNSYHLKQKYWKAVHSVCRRKMNKHSKGEVEVLCCSVFMCAVKQCFMKVNCDKDVLKLQPL
jgi:hypothetical protein